jgi:hypothetical protein
VLLVRVQSPAAQHLQQPIDCSNSSHYCDFSLFSLFQLEIYSELGLVRRRNPRFWWLGQRNNSEPPAVISLFWANQYSVAN